MSTSPGPGTKEFSPETIEKKVYTVVEGLKEYLPMENDRNRLAFNLVNFKKGTGDSPEVSVKVSKLNFEGIAREAFTKLLVQKLEEAFK